MTDLLTTEQIRRLCAKGYQDTAPPPAWDDHKFMASAYERGLVLFDRWLADLKQRTATGKAR